MNLMQHFAEHMEFCGLGVLSTAEQEGNIFWGFMPDHPDFSICVYSSDTGVPGSESGARLQVLVRAKTTKQSYEKSQEIAETLLDFDGFLHGDGPQVEIETINASQGLGQDDKRREMFVSNYRVRYCNY